MKNVIQNLVGVVVVAAMVYGGVVYGVKEAPTMQKEAKICLMDTCIIEHADGTHTTVLR